MTKICHMTSAHDSDDIRIFYKECTSLAKAGYEVYLVAHGDSGIRNGVNIVGLPSPASRMKRMFFFSRKVYKSALGIDARIYHFHDPELLPYALKLKKKGKIVIFDSHEDVPKQIFGKPWIPKFLRGIVSRAYEYYENSRIKKLDAIVTVVEPIADRFKNIHSNVVLLKNYPLLDDIECNNSDFCNRERIVCYAGGVSKARGVLNAVRAIDGIDVQFYIAGEIDENFMCELSSLPGVSKVKALGRIDRRHINDLYNKSMAGLCTLRYTPNNYNSLPIKMFEYMAAGIPVVCSDFPIWREIMDTIKCGLCVGPEDIEAIKNAIDYLIHNPKEAKQMGENGRNAVLEQYNWSIEEKKLLELVGSLLGMGSIRGGRHNGD